MKQSFTPNAGDNAGVNIPQDDRYTPIPGGWQIHLRPDGFYRDIREKNRTVDRGGRQMPAIDFTAGRLPAETSFGRELKPEERSPHMGRLTAEAPIGLLLDNPRKHWRPLYPPGEKSLIWTEEEQTCSPRICFRPMILCGTVPRFLLEYHDSAGLLGHVRLGLTGPDGGRWFHEWSDIVVRHVDGRMEYELRDEAWPGATIRVVASPMEGAVGLILRVEVKGAPKDADLIWSYGGATTYYKGWSLPLDSPQLDFAPEQCMDNDYILAGATFEMVRRVCNFQIGCIKQYIPEWNPRIYGGSSWAAGLGFGAADAFGRRPNEILQSADFQSKSFSDGFVLERVPLRDGSTEGFILIGMGFGMAGALSQPARAWEAALARNAGIARRIVTRTPDPHLDAAMTTIAFANEGTWASQAFVHGGWSWRGSYMGWRVLYGPMVYGWADRVRKNILNHCRLGVTQGGCENQDTGAIASTLGDNDGIFYNMSEVFFDMIRHYFDHTDDVPLMREIFTVLEGALEWENRRLRPAGGDLYENALNTWISDTHWYIEAQCTQASAYMLRMHEFMASIAPRIGRNGHPFREQAGRIRQAMQQTLWQKRRGVFAECVDTRGNRLLHGEPELATLYHSAEFGAADPLQVYQMLRWADAHLRQEQTPGGGRLYWSSNWFPNRGRTYTHSTYEMNYGEELNFAETNFLAGRANVGYAILRACLSGVFNGPVPGGLSCHAFVDGLQRSNPEFADSSSMWGRAVVEGLFGIRVRRPQQLVELTPQTPFDWPEASIETPHFTYRIRRDKGQVLLEWTSPVEAALKLRLPLAISRRPVVLVNGRKTTAQLEKGVGFTWICIDIPKAGGGEVRIDYEPAKVTEAISLRVKQGGSVRILPTGRRLAAYDDPQGLLAEAGIADGALTGRVAGEAGPGVLFVSEEDPEAPCWLPVDVSIEPDKPKEKRLWHSPAPDDAKSLERWTLIDLERIFNVSIPEIPQRVAEGAVPPPLPYSRVGFRYWKYHLNEHSKPPCDTAWRAKVGADRAAWTTDGIPFKSNKEGSNIAVACLHNRNYPATVVFPVKASGRALYLMLHGATWPAQSHVVNLRITLRYASGESVVHDLVQPFDIGSCWDWPGPGVFHDTPSNGFENIGGRSGPMGSSQVADLTKPIAMDTSAHLLRFDLLPGKRLEQVGMEIIANDVVFGVMGASVLK